MLVQSMRISIIQPYQAKVLFSIQLESLDTIIVHSTLSFCFQSNYEFNQITNSIKLRIYQIINLIKNLLRI